MTLSLTISLNSNKEAIPFNNPWCAFDSFSKAHL
jgi:hypothetical protein